MSCFQQRGAPRQPAWLGDWSWTGAGLLLRESQARVGAPGHTALSICTIFHDNDPQRFEAQQARDQRKREAVQDAFVALVEVPCTVPYVKIRDRVLKEVCALGYSAVTPTLSLREFLTRARADGDQAVVYLDKARETAGSHGGTRTSDVYVGCHTRWISSARRVTNSGSRGTRC
jgi:hypothetical protein